MPTVPSAHARPIELLGSRLLCLDLETLIAVKRAAGRPKDLETVAQGVNLDFDADGRLVGIDIDHASETVNLERLEAESLPISSVSLSQT